MDILSNSIEEKVRNFNQNREKHQGNYILTVEIKDTHIVVNKEGLSMDLNSTLFFIEKQGDAYTLHTMLDDVEGDILESIQSEGYEGTSNHWFLEFKISLKNGNEVLEFLDKHFWTKDLGKLY